MAVVKGAKPPSGHRHDAFTHVLINLRSILHAWGWTTDKFCLVGHGFAPSVLTGPFQWTHGLRSHNWCTYCACEHALSIYINDRNRFAFWGRSGINFLLFYGIFDTFSCWFPRLEWKEIPERILPTTGRERGRWDGAHIQVNAASQDSSFLHLVFNLTHVRVQMGVSTSHQTEPLNFPTSDLIIKWSLLITDTTALKCSRRASWRGGKWGFCGSVGVTHWDFFLCPCDQSPSHIKCIKCVKLLVPPSSCTVDLQRSAGSTPGQKLLP